MGGQFQFNLNRMFWFLQAFDDDDDDDDDDDFEEEEDFDDVDATKELLSLSSLSLLRMFPHISTQEIPPHAACVTFHLFAFSGCRTSERTRGHQRGFWGSMVSKLLGGSSHVVSG